MGEHWEGWGITSESRNEGPRVCGKEKGGQYGWVGGWVVGWVGEWVGGWIREGCSKGGLDGRLRAAGLGGVEMGIHGDRLGEEMTQ